MFRYNSCLYYFFETSNYFICFSSTFVENKNSQFINRFGVEGGGSINLSVEFQLENIHINLHSEYEI